MKKSRKIRYGLIIAGLLLSPFASNFVTGPVLAESPKKHLVFSSSTDITETLKFIKESDEDESIKKVRKKINDETLSLYVSDEIPKHLDGQFAIAFPIEKVKNNAKIKKELQRALHDGAKVFLYGNGVTINEYKKLLNLDQVYAYHTDKNGDKIKIGFGDRSKADKIKGKRRNEVTEQYSYNVIGYTLDDSAVDKLTIINITVSDGKKESNVSEEHILREIVDNLSMTIDKEEKRNLSSRFFNNVAYAETVPVDSSNATIVGSAYFDRPYPQSDILAGRTFTDWILYQVEDDNDEDRDYFYLQEGTQIDDYNGFVMTELQSRHELPYEVDDLDDWEPDDDSSSPYSINFGIPWSVSFTFEMSGSPSIDASGSRENDWARWIVTGSIDEDDDFQPASAWRSVGTLAAIDMTVKGEFYNSIHGWVTSSVPIDIYYNY